MTVNVMNMPESVKKYVVARAVDGTLWYWGTWNDKAEAERVADEIDGLVVENAEK